jgi:hypothetical protein
MNPRSIVMASLVVALLSQVCSAYIIYSGSVDLVVTAPPPPVPPSIDSVNFRMMDVNGDGTDDLRLNYERTSSTAYSFLASRNGTLLANVVGAGSPVGAGATFQTTVSIHGPGSPPAQRLFGFSLPLADGVHFGWIQTEYSGNQSVTVRGWAYESVAGVSIGAGQIPAPAAGLMLLPVLAGRRRR